MPLWRKILCAVDGSETSHAALREASRIAETLGAELLILHVRPDGPSTLGVPFAPPPRAREGAVGDAPSFDSWVKEAQATVPVATSLELTGSPAEEIVRTVAEFGSDLVVMGTHGRGALARFALGSVTGAVIREASCPVLVVRRAPQA